MWPGRAERALCRPENWTSFLTLPKEPTTPTPLPPSESDSHLLFFFIIISLHQHLALGGARSPLIGHSGTDCTLPCPRHVVGLLGWTRCSSVGVVYHLSPGTTPRTQVPPLVAFYFVIIRVGRNFFPSESKERFSVFFFEE